MENATPFDQLEEKWNPVLETSALPSLDDHYKRKVTACLLENTENALREQMLNETPANAMGGGFAVSAAKKHSVSSPVLVTHPLMLPSLQLVVLSQSLLLVPVPVLHSMVSVRCSQVKVNLSVEERLLIWNSDKWLSLSKESLWKPRLVL